MSARIYKWTKTDYERDEIGRGKRWNETKSKIEYMTDNWAETMTSDEELSFWRNLGECVVSRDPYKETVKVTRTSPDRLRKSVELFEPVNCNPWRNAGNRERSILENFENLRILPMVETSEDHIVIELRNEDKKALLDLTDSRYVG